MAVDATGTRAKLMAAGEELFAVHGIYGAQMRDIVRAAGQANDSAVHYHFGSREGLLRGICEKHIDAMEPARRRLMEEQGDQPELDTIVHDLVRPTAEKLRTQDGRFFLRITNQLAGQAGVRTGSVPPPVVRPALRAQLHTLQEACARSMPAELAGERIAIMIGALTAALADRAVGIDEGTAFALDEDAFLANLEGMLVAALRAPVPAVIAS
jgi:TetR/AcrR family transcriptional regulator, regulator of cefoperazone and chloramphenicol sensitivity